MTCQNGMATLHGMVPAFLPLSQLNIAKQIDEIRSAMGNEGKIQTLSSAIRFSSLMKGRIVSTVFDEVIQPVVLFNPENHNNPSILTSYDTLIQMMISLRQSANQIQSSTMNGMPTYHWKIFWLRIMELRWKRPRRSKCW